MRIVSLRDLYVAELRDLYDAERQILQELSNMAALATSSHLITAFHKHVEQARLHVERLELLFHQLGEAPGGHTCEAVRGMIEEARLRTSDTEKGDVLDAALIGSAQRIEHYEIAAYGCARTYAETLGDHQAAHVLQQTLEEEGAADHRLTRIAEHGINEAAGEDVLEDATRYRSHLRYMSAGDLPDFRFAGYHVVNRNEEDLGTLDGFIVESPSGRPLYFVADSGGWFVGRRYVIPVGQLQVDQVARVLWTDLDRQTISRYPAFDTSAFMAMDDYEATRYEHRLLDVVMPGRRTPGGRRPRYEEFPAYQPPNWLMTGVWMTDASGLAAAPPRADSDLRPTDVARPVPEPRIHEHVAEAYPENELMTARGDEQPKSGDPRIERYRER